MDQDYDIDVLSADGRIAWYENDGNQNFTEILLSTYMAYSIYATDLDGDTDVDVLGISFYDNNVSWFENEDGNFSVHLISNELLNPRSVYAIDIDRDNDVDVLISSSFAKARSMPSGVSIIW